MARFALTQVQAQAYSTWLARLTALEIEALQKDTRSFSNHQASGPFWFRAEAAPRDLRARRDQEHYGDRRRLRILAAPRKWRSTRTSSKTSKECVSYSRQTIFSNAVTRSRTRNPPRRTARSSSGRAVGDGIARADIHQRGNLFTLRRPTSPNASCATRQAVVRAAGRHRAGRGHRGLFPCRTTPEDTHVFSRRGGLIQRPASVNTTAHKRIAVRPLAGDAIVSPPYA